MKAGRNSKVYSSCEDYPLSKYAQSKILPATRGTDIGATSLFDASRRELRAPRIQLKNIK